MAGRSDYDASTLEGTPSDITAAVRTRDGTVWMGSATQGLFAYPYRRTLDQPEDLRDFRTDALESAIQARAGKKTE